MIAVTTKKRNLGGRPPDAARARGVIVATRALGIERDAWRRAAKAAGVPLGVWLRNVANRAAARAKGA